MAENLVRAVLTQRGANALAQITARLITTQGMTHFRIGEGGFVIMSGTKFPKTPTNAQVLLDADDPALIPSLTVTLGHVPFVFQKSFVAADFTIESTVIFRADPLVDFLEANDNGVGGAPRFFELGYYLTNTITARQIGLGDGINDQFLMTAPALPVEAGTFSMSVSSPVMSVTDDGAGNLIGNINGLGVNTINYLTGAINVTFSSVPAVNIPILATYTSKPLLVYGTFPEEIKTAAIQLKKILRIAY